MNTKVIDFMRHGQPALLGAYLGKTDCELSETGRLRSQAALENNAGWELVVSSPLKRCREMAEWFAHTHKLPLLIVDELAEYSFGQWDGCGFEDVYESDQESADRFWDNPEQNPPPGGEHVADFKLRVKNARNKLLSMDAQSILVITHAGVIRCMLADFLGIAACDWAKINVDYSSFTQLRFAYSADQYWPALVSSNTRKPTRHNNEVHRDS